MDYYIIQGYTTYREIKMQINLKFYLIAAVFGSFLLAPAISSSSDHPPQTFTAANFSQIIELPSVTHYKLSCMARKSRNSAKIMKDYIDQYSQGQPLFVCIDKQYYRAEGLLELSTGEKQKWRAAEKVFFAYANYLSKLNIPNVQSEIAKIYFLIAGVNEIIFDVGTFLEEDLEYLNIAAVFNNMVLGIPGYKINHHNLHKVKTVYKKLARNLCDSAERIHVDKGIFRLKAAIIWIEVICRLNGDFENNLVAGDQAQSLEEKYFYYAEAVNKVNEVLKRPNIESEYLTLFDFATLSLNIGRDISSKAKKVKDPVVLYDYLCQAIRHYVKYLDILDYISEAT